MPSNLNIRLHHLDNIYDGLSYLTSENIFSHPLSEVYQHPRIVRQLAAQIANKTFSTFVGNKDNPSISAEKKNYYLDLLGADRISNYRFRGAIFRNWVQILGLNPTTPVTLNYQPDLFCHSCQSNGKDNVGNHCKKSVSYESNLDNYTRHALSYLRANNYRSRLSSNRLDRSFTCDLDLIRNMDFMEEVHRIVQQQIS